MSAGRIRIGILGAGRLGRALARRLVAWHEVVLSDVDSRRAKQAAKQAGTCFMNEGELILRSQVVIICVPPSEVTDLVRRLAELPVQAHPLYLNTATDVDTPALVAELGLTGLRIIGFKPIGQFAAIALGLPVVFITSSEDLSDLALARRVADPLGPILLGDERRVSLLNRHATRLALQFCLHFDEALASLIDDPAWAASARRSIVVGTILDYPPDTDNAYTASLLEELR